MRIHPRRSRRRSPRGAGCLARALLLFLVFVLLGSAAYLVYERTRPGSAFGDEIAALGEGSPRLNPVERLALSAYLQLRAADLARPAALDSAPVAFTVMAGESASRVGARLAEVGLITDPVLFAYYMRYAGLDAGIEAGEFSLSASQTIPEIAATLSHAFPEEFTLTAIEGWRAEQIASALSTAGLPIAPEEFMALVRAGSQSHALSAVIPPGTGLEGFLFPDTYRFPPDVTAAEVLDRFLDNFDRRVTPEIRAAAAARGRTVYEIVVLASIVEREAVVEDERPIIASVFHNRLALGMKLDADPTVQYALGYQAGSGEWWKRPLTWDDLAFDSPYNTYLYTGLPPAPISNPGLSSIQAAAFPTDTPYLYFRARCDGSGRHRFAATFEEHTANACP